MTVTKMHMIGAGSAFLFIFLFGFGLSGSGKPYGTAILTGLKVLSLGVLIWLGVTTHRMNQMAPLNPMEWIAVVAAVLFMVATMTTGALLTIGKPMPVIVSMLHQVSPYMTVLLTAAALFLLSGLQSQIPPQGIQ